MFVLLSNLLGMIPTSFSTTSQIAVTGTLALMVFLTVTLVGFWRKGIGFLSMFWVASAPLALRQQLDLYVCLRPIHYFPGVPSPSRVCSAPTLGSSSSISK